VLKIILLCFLSFTAQATIFKPQPINQQIREADGVFVGNFLRQKSVELEDGRIATQMIFKMLREHGLQSELFGMDEIIVHYPGGSLKGRNLKVEGVPSFIPGEKVAVFIRSQQNRYWGMNLGFGTFKVVNYGKETMLVNSVFPDHPKVGQMTLTNFELALKSVKGVSMKKVFSPDQQFIQPKDEVVRMPASFSAEAQNRSIASGNFESEHEGAQASLNVIWLVGVLSFLGGLFRIYRQRSSK
jgi:hypothetical protein